MRHWHIALLPPRVPYAQQDFEALRFENGVLTATERERAELAERLRGPRRPGLTDRRQPPPPAAPRSVVMAAR